MKDALRTTLVEGGLRQTDWRRMLPKIIFALNTSISNATKRTPYEVVFGRTAVLPLDAVFGDTRRVRGVETTEVEEYVDELKRAMKEVY